MNKLDNHVKNELYWGTLQLSHRYNNLIYNKTSKELQIYQV